MDAGFVLNNCFFIRIKARSKEDVISSYICIVIKALRYLKNKYILTIVIVGVYTLFLDDADVFTIVRQRIKLSKLQAEKEQFETKLIETQEVLSKLNSLEALERFAREEKMFKKDDEDIFVVVE